MRWEGEAQSAPHQYNQPSRCPDFPAYSTAASNYLDAPVAQELLHAVPGGVSLAHELEHALKHISNGVGRRFQGADLVEVVRLDLAYSQAGSLNDGRYHRQL